ncbi:MAG: substrate-binding domain-containing protein [Ruminococcus sp.]|nr:substrate-binding domain-containing protein [Ruminococcus sp.]
MKKRLLIGVVMTDCNNDFQEEQLRGIISQAFRSDTDIAVITTMHNFYFDSLHKNTDKYICDLVFSDKFSGFLYVRNSFGTEKIRRYIDDILLMTGKPVMLLDFPGHRHFETTAIDDCSAFEKITDHLIEVHGCRKIYCLTGPKGIFVSEERLKGYRNSMKLHGIPVEKNYCRYGDFWKDASKSLAAEIITGKNGRPDAVVCGNDVMAIELTNALISGGVRVPEDIAVTGYDDSADARSNIPSITTYKRPNFQLGAEAFRRLYRIITGKICSMIPNEYGKISLGRSCGCFGTERIRREDTRREIMDKRLESYLLYGDMLFDITNTDSLSVFADKLDNYTYLVYKNSKLKICLTKKYIESTMGIYNDKLSFHCGDELKIILSKVMATRKYDEISEYFSSAEILPEYSQNRNYPVAYYISPLHYNDNFFGYCAVSFGKNPMAYSTHYLQWINYVNVALEQVRIKGILSNNILRSNMSMLYDSTTDLLNRSGTEQELLRHREFFTGDLAAEIITIELVGLNKVYYSSGEERCSNILKAFADVLKRCVRDNEICGLWNNNTMCIFSRDKKRACEISEFFRNEVEESRFSENNFNIDFSVGLYSVVLNEEVNFGSAVYQSMVNKIFSYNNAENLENPQYEKLCALRSSIRKNPAFPWKINEIAESLYLSKSYLQKIYKNFFNKSIIEEMIGFRIEMARNLLEKTQLTVTEISRKCGYSSYNYFVRQFRSIVGCTPVEYREKSR